jgi:acetyl-CoA carboxylase carboxyltransferase component
MREKIHKVEVLKEELRKGGGFEEIEKQHQKGKLTARERIERFLDPDTFEEIELLTLPIYTGFESDKKSIRGDGLVSGYGRVNGRPVCVWAQDATVNGGGMGVIHRKKIVTLMERALKAGIPCIGIVDSEGVRVEEAISTPTKYSYDRIMYT